MTNDIKLEGGRIRLIDIADERRHIRNLTATQVTFIGPAVMISAGDVTLNGGNWDPLGAGIEGIIWEVDPKRPAIAGAVALFDCVFTDCTFVNIGMGMHPDKVAGWLAQGQV